MTDQDNHNEHASSPNGQPVEATSQASSKPKRLWGWWMISILFGGYMFFFLMPLVGIVFNSEMYAHELYSVKHDLFDYVKKHDQFPPAEKWCDAILEQEGDVWPCLKTYESDKDSCPFILNRHILEHKELPDNMVVAFFGGNAWKAETSGWNQVGDIEQVKDNDRVAMLFGNGEVYVFRKKLAPYLRWRFEDRGVIPEPYLEIPFLVMSVLLAIMFSVILMTYLDGLKIFWRLALGIGVTSAILGAYLCGLATRLFYLFNFKGYLLNHTEYLLIPWIGPIVGFAVGVCFIAVLGTIYKKYHTNVNMFSFAIVLGPMTGVAASSIIHGYLMLAYRETGFRYMLAGSLFGIIAGGVLGLFSATFITVYQDKISVQNEGQRLNNASS